ncbi:MAG TPA: ATP-binding cassette domain-containing protein [Acidimicrobiia bacterium]
MLEVENLSKTYGEVVALDQCSFVVHPGKLTGFVGPNGAGKTTTMRAVFGLVVPDEGAIRWQGSPITRTTRKRFGYMPEERGLYPKMQVREQVIHFGFITGMNRTEAAHAADRILERLGLSERATASVEELSHGNQQRAQLAVALVHDPELLILDEPFAGLDPIAVGNLGGMLEDLAAEGRTVLFSSHQLDLVEDLCEDVVTINNGQIVLAGKLSELRGRARRWHVRVEVANAESDWFQALPGVEIIEQTNGNVELVADRSVDVGSIVSQAQEAGEIRQFDYDPPTLSQLFREAVGS